MSSQETKETQEWPDIEPAEHLGGNVYHIESINALGEFAQNAHKAGFEVREVGTRLGSGVLVYITSSSLGDLEAILDKLDAIEISIDKAGR